MRRSIILSFMIISLLLIPYSEACGCGLALSDMKVFNALKETQAYLMIDIHNETSYTEMPFFRMVSMDEPYNVTIVFPMDQIPSSVEGETITAEEFLSKYNVRKAEYSINAQSTSGMLKQIGKSTADIGKGGFVLSNGLIGMGVFFTRGLMSGGKFALQMDGIVAHYEFEGGSLDIYDVKSADTLDSLVKKLNMNSTGEVEKLIEKYKDYYVAVLYLKVPSAVDQSTRNQLQRCPGGAEKTKRMLQEKTEFTYQEVADLQEMYPQCELAIQKLIEAATSVNSDVKGTLVKMTFEGTDVFFYPTSIVNSYKYPITDQKYFIRAPKELDIGLNSSKVSSKAVVEDKRWYKVTSTEEDIKGEIKLASGGVLFEDKLRLARQSIYDNSEIIASIIIVLIVLLPFTYYFTRVDENLSWKDIVSAAAVFIILGMLFASIVSFARKKWKLGATILSVWVILMIITII